MSSRPASGPGGREVRRRRGPASIVSGPRVIGSLRCTAVPGDGPQAVTCRVLKFVYMPRNVERNVRRPEEGTVRPMPFAALGRARQNILRYPYDHTPDEETTAMTTPRFRLSKGRRRKDRNRKDVPFFDQFEERCLLSGNGFIQGFVHDSSPTNPIAGQRSSCSPAATNRSRLRS